MMKSPLPNHGKIQEKLDKLNKKYGDTDFYEREDVKSLIKKKTAAKKAHKSSKKTLPIDDKNSYEYDYDQNEDITTAEKSPLLGAYENAADGGAFMGGLVSGQQQFAKLQQDITKGFDNFMKGEGTQQLMEKNSQDKINSMKVGETQGKGKKNKTITQKNIDSAQVAHNKRFNTKGGVKCPQGETLEPIRLKNGQKLYGCIKNNE